MKLKIIFLKKENKVAKFKKKIKEKKEKRERKY
jgi:hypothetical protein